MKRALCLLLLPALCLLARAQTPTSTPVPVPAAQYRAELQRAEARLRAMENSTQRPLAPLLKNLGSDKRVRRADGATQIVRGDEWQRRAIEAPGNATRSQVTSARQNIEARLEALDEWQRRDASGTYFAGAEAQTRINQLEATDVIRTQPTAFESWWSRTKKALGDMWDRFTSWINRATPAPTAPSTPSIDPIWIQALFVASVLALLGLIGFLIWRAVGNPFAGRSSHKRDEPVGEDEALLRLPPDELLERARAYARAGDFREALRHVYIRLLLQLDARGVWRYDARRTNWEHIELLRRHQAHAGLAVPLSDLTRRFDRVRYGGASCDSSDWQRFEHDALQLEQQTAGGGRQAADGKPQEVEKSG